MTATQLSSGANTARPAAYGAAPTAPPLSSPSPSRRWTASQRIAFRLAFSYFVLYCTPSLFGSVPGLNVIAGWYGEGVRALSIAFGQRILHLTAQQLPVIPTGSGDGMVAWMMNLVFILAAIIATTIWTFADRRREEYRTLYEWLRIYVRFTLAFVLFGYGIAKIIPTQFPYPQLERLAEPLGEFSPMGLLWTFMGYSPAYNVFTGMGEAVGGLLVCFRRTTTAGALLLIAVMSNVVFLNFAYDVPVKLYSANLLLMALFLTLPDIGRLANVLVFNRPTQHVDLRPPYRTRAMVQATWVLRLVLILIVVEKDVKGGLLYRKVWNGPPPTLYGIYDVQSLTRNGADVPLLVTDASAWRRVVFGRLDRMVIRTMSDSVGRYTTKIDTVAKTIVSTSRDDSTKKAMFAYSIPAAHELALVGRLGGDSIVARMRRVDEGKFLLNTRGFNLVQELPFNR